MRVRVARVRRRETQEQLAARAAVSRVTLGSIERGDHEAGSEHPRAPRAILGVQLDELLNGAS